MTALGSMTLLGLWTSFGWVAAAAAGVLTATLAVWFWTEGERVIVRRKRRPRAVLASQDGAAGAPVGQQVDPLRESSGMGEGTGDAL